MKHLTAALALCAVLAWVWPAQAATVIMLLPTNPSADVTEALNLLRGELLSVGLEVTMRPHSSDHDQRALDSRRWIEVLTAGGASAVIDTVEVNAGLAVDVWVARTHPSRFEVTRVAVESDTPKASEVLALRAVEALRAGLILIDRAARKQQPNAKPAQELVPANAEGSPEEHRDRWGVEVGATALTSLNEVGLAFLPMVRVGWVARPSLLVQASLLGAGTRPTVTMAGGAVRVARQYGILGASYRLRARERLWPFLALAAGGMHTAVEGQADADTDGGDVDQWSWLVEGSLGAGLQVSRRYYVTLAVHVQWTEPYVVIHSADAASVTTGRPSLALTLTVGAWL